MQKTVLLGETVCFGGSDMATKKYEIDMCQGPILPAIVSFTIPLIASSILQLLFNAADVIVVGKWAGDESLAAVGSTTALINLLVNIFMGLSIGANVLVAKAIGAGNDRDVTETVHTAILTSIIGGVILAFIGIAVSKPVLLLMGTPDNVINKSCIYIRIYFAGMPALLSYNFGSAILRAVGDTKRPLYYLSAAGVLNIGLNLFFVIVFNMDVAGVALATIISEMLSSILVIRCLTKQEGCYRLYLNKLKIHREKFKKILSIGLPAGFQGSLFSISNVLIQSSINTFGAYAMAGSAAASNIEGFIYVAMNAHNQAAVSFCGQNYGSRNYDRIKKVVITCIALVSVVGFVLGLAAYLLGPSLLSIYTDTQESIDYGMIRLFYICILYFTCGIMDTMVGALRGLCYTISPMIITLLGVCGFRIIYIFTVFKLFPTFECLYLSYPLSWIISVISCTICLVIVLKKVKKELSIQNVPSI